MRLPIETKCNLGELKCNRINQIKLRYLKCQGSSQVVGDRMNSLESDGDYSDKQLLSDSYQDLGLDHYLKRRS